MPDDIAMPWFTHWDNVSYIFLFSLAIFHGIFIYAAPLSKVSWKKVDYIWLSMAFIGMLSSLANNRGMIANNLLKIENVRFESSRTYILDRITDGTSASVCRQFQQSEIISGDQLKALQNAFDSECSWFKQAEKKMRLLPNAVTNLHMSFFSPYPANADRDRLSDLKKAIEMFNEEGSFIKELQEQAQESAFETVLKLLGPSIIAIALALRMTKVTADVKS